MSTPDVKFFAEAKKLRYDQVSCLLSVIYEMAERVGFEPTCPLRDKTLSRRPRYDHFGTSPCGAEHRVQNFLFYLKRRSGWSVWLR
jgi:hypothetical protein